MKKYEYLLLTPESSVFKGYNYQKINEQLNQLGSLGWEVVSTASVPAGSQLDGLLITLKREIQ